MKNSETIGKISAALVAAQAEIGMAKKDASNPFFKSKYADLSSVMDACKPALIKNGIAIVQSPAESPLTGFIAIDTILLHSSGEWISGTTVMPIGKMDPQGFGSAMTYARRYSLAAMTGVCPEDDDGEGAAGRGAPQGKGGQNQKSAPIQDAKAFTISTSELLESRGFSPDDIVKFCKHAAGQKKKPSIGTFSAAERSSLIAAISAGRCDKFKTTNAAPTGPEKE